MEEPSLIVNDDQPRVGRIVELSDRAVARLNLKQIQKEYDREKAERAVIEAAKEWRKMTDLLSERRLRDAVEALLASE